MRYLYVALAPEVSEEDRRTVSGCLARHFALPVRETAMASVDFAYDRAREQFSSQAVLEMLAGQIPDDAAKLLAVTGRDLFVPVLTFVFGQAQLGGRVAVVSLARLRQEFYGLPPNHEVLATRAAKEVLHETGHLFGLVHCAERSCAMSLATNVRQIDAKRAAFCGACEARLRQQSGGLGK